MKQLVVTRTGLYFPTLTRGDLNNTPMDFLCTTQVCIHPNNFNNLKGDTPELAKMVQNLRDHAFKMAGTSPSPSSTPDTPLITLLKKGQIAWRGVVAAGTLNF
ncbi:hypothetical protein M1146_06470 [Patescibacteria group bacterium]|nr:hypothetical protein [Patescibacteria group bacterium]